MEERTCRVCEQTLPITRFEQHGYGKKGRRWQCKDCRKKIKLAVYRANQEVYDARAIAWRQANPEAVREHDRRRYAKSPHRRLARRALMYGLTVAEIEAIRERQGGVCAICRQGSPNERDLCIDHDHSTGEVRGLLCVLCNSGLGQFRDDPVILRAAIEYLATS
jgi:hypothetical protein